MVVYVLLLITEVLFTLLASQPPPRSNEIRMSFWTESTRERGLEEKVKESMGPKE